MTLFSIVACDDDIRKKLGLQAKREYERDAEHRVYIFLVNLYATSFRLTLSFP